MLTAEPSSFCVNRVTTLIATVSTTRIPTWAARKKPAASFVKSASGTRLNKEGAKRPAAHSIRTRAPSKIPYAADETYDRPVDNPPAQKPSHRAISCLAEASVSSDELKHVGIHPGPQTLQ